VKIIIAGGVGVAGAGVSRVTTAVVTRVPVGHSAGGGGDATAVVTRVPVGHSAAVTRATTAFVTRVPAERGPTHVNSEVTRVPVGHSAVEGDGPLPRRVAAGVRVRGVPLFMGRLIRAAGQIGVRGIIIRKLMFGILAMVSARLSHLRQKTALVVAVRVPERAVRPVGHEVVVGALGGVVEELVSVTCNRVGVIVLVGVV